MNRRSTTSVFFYPAIALFLLMPHPAHAQVAGATLSGTITDPQGGAIANASVSAQNVATGVAAATTSNSAGAYTLPNLIPGDYQVTVSVTGFTTAVAKVTLTVGAKQELNIPLAVGAVATQVEVAGAR